MSYEKCLTSFNEATGLDLSKEESDKILRTMINAKNRIVRERGFASADAMAAAADEAAKAKLQAAKKAQLEVMRDAYKRTIMVDQVKTNGGLRQAFETLRSAMVGGNKLKDGGRDSVENNWHTNRDGWSNAINNKLFKAGLKKIAEGGTLDKEVSEAWWKLNNKEDPGKGPAADIARVYFDGLDKIRDKLNGSGANIKDALNYATTTEWSPERLRQAGGTGMTPDEAFEAWWKSDGPRMSEKTFKDLVPNKGEDIAAARKRVARNMFDGAVSGVHMTVGDVEAGAPLPTEYEGTSNVANKVSAHRTIIWKDAASWFAHNQEFGTSPTLHASVLGSVDRGARALALMDKFGNNPSANLNMVIRRIEETYRGDVDGLKRFQAKTKNLTNMMKDLDGTLNRPQNMGLEKFTSSVLQAEVMSTLGGVGITHGVSIWPTVTSELAHHGINRLSAMGELLRGLTKGLGEGERRDILSDLGAHADSAYRHVRGKIGDDSVPGRISSMAGRFMDMTGVHLVYDRAKAAIRGTLAHNLARNLGKSWEQLDPHLSDMLGRYRITPHEWELMRGLKDLPADNGRQYLTPSSISEGLDHAATEAHLRESGVIGDKPEDVITHANGVKSYSKGQIKDVTTAVRDFKENLSDKILSYYSDAAKHGVVTPGVRERAMLLQGTQKGTGANTMLRFLTQFKMWPVAAYNQILEREIYTSLSGKEAAWNIGKLVAIGVPAGYLRMVINDAAAGRPIHDPRDPKVLLEAAAKSGGLGIAGDLLFGETNRMAGGIMSIAGPVANDVSKLYQMFGQFKEDTMGEHNHRNGGRYGDIWPELARFGVGHIPFANLIYLKGTLDYMLWYHLYEAASPGWWERTNQRLEKERSQTMTGYSPGAGVPRGVPGVYLKNNSGSTGLLGNGKAESE